MVPVSDIQQSALQVVIDPKPRSSGAQDALVSGLKSVLAEQKDRGARDPAGLLFQLGTAWWLQQGARGCSGVLRGAWVMGEDLDGRPWCSHHGAAPSRVTPGDFGWKPVLGSLSPRVRVGQTLKKWASV